MKTIQLTALALSFAAASFTMADVFVPIYNQPSMDRWMYPFNSTPGAELRAPLFGAIQVASFDDRDSEMLLKFDTTADVPTGLPLTHYKVVSVTMKMTVATSTAAVFYDPTADAVATSYTIGEPGYVADSDPSKPVEMFGVGYRNGFTVNTFNEASPFGCMGFPVEGCRNVYPIDVDSNGAPVDISRQVRLHMEATPWAIGTSSTLTAGDVLVAGTELTFNFDLSRPGVRAYFRQAMADGKLMVAATSLHAASGGPGGGTSSDYPSFHTKEGNAAAAGKLELRVRVYEGADYNGDGVVDFFDYLDFVDDFSGGMLDADFNEDGVIDFFDYLDFVDAFAR